ALPLAGEQREIHRKLQPQRYECLEGFVLLVGHVTIARPRWMPLHIAARIRIHPVPATDRLGECARENGELSIAVDLAASHTHELAEVPRLHVVRYAVSEPCPQGADVIGVI